MSRGSYGNDTFSHICVLFISCVHLPTAYVLYRRTGAFTGAFTPHAPGNSYSPHPALPTPYCGNSFTVSLAAPFNTSPTYPTQVTHTHTPCTMRYPPQSPMHRRLTLRIVDLPHPLGPTIPTRSPCLNWRDTLRRTGSSSGRDG